MVDAPKKVVTLLVDRDAELAELRRAVHALAFRGRSGVLTLAGRRGTGLTALLDAAAGQARALGVLTAVARCTPAETDLRYGVISQLAAGLGGVEHRPALRPLWEPGPPEAAVPGLCAEFLALATRHPLLLAVDDTQWADPDSRRWLDALAHRIQHAPVLLVQVTAGPPPEPAEVLHVRPLGELAIRRLIASMCAGPVEETFSAGAVAATGGSPAVLRVVLDRFARLDLPPVGEHLPVLAEQVAQVVGDRAAPVISRLPADALNLLRAMAVCGDALDFDLVDALAAPQVVPAPDALRLLVRLGLVTPGEPRPAVPPDVVLGGMTAAERDDLAARAVELARRAAVPDDRLATLLLQVPTGTGWAVPVLRRVAARRRAAGDARVATELLTRALREDARDPGLLVDLALADPRTADHRLQQVLLDPGTGVADAVRAADLLQCGGDAPAAHRAIAVACRRHPDSGALAAAGALAAGDSANDPVLPVLPSLPLAEDPDDPAVAGVVAWRLAMRGRRRSTVRRLARFALTGAHYGSRLHAARALRCAGDLVEAVHGLDDVLRDARRDGARVPAVLALLERGRCELARGNLDRVAVDLDAARAELASEYWHPRLLPWLIALDAARHLDAGDVALAEEVLAADLPAAAAGGVAWAHLLCARGSLRLALADPRAALPYLLDCGRAFAARGWSSPAVSPWRSLAARAHAACGDSVAADRLVRDAADRARRWGAPATRDQVERLASVVDCPQGTLSVEEERVATLAAGGWTNADIGRVLSLGTRTVEARLTGVYRKLALTGRRELAEVFRPVRMVG